MTNALVKSVGSPLDLVSATTRKFAENTKSKNTRRAYKSAFNDFTVYCVDRKKPYLPSSPATVADYISDLAEHANAKISTLKVRLAAISLAHKLHGYEDPTQDKIVGNVLSGISREKGLRQRQAAPILKVDLLKIVAEEPEKLVELRNRTILLVGWFGAFRRNELVNIKVNDLTFDDYGVKIMVPFSKTDQFGKGKKKHLPYLKKNKSICPVLALRKWLETSSIADGFIFRKINRWGKIGKGKPGREHIYPHVVSRIVKRAVTKIGFNPKNFSAHSLRAGFITQACLDGYDALAIIEVSLHETIETVVKYERSEGVKAREIIKGMFGE